MARENRPTSLFTGEADAEADRPKRKKEVRNEVSGQQSRKAEEREAAGAGLLKKLLLETKRGVGQQLSAPPVLTVGVYFQPSEGSQPQHRVRIASYKVHKLLDSA